MLQCSIPLIRALMILGVLNADGAVTTRSIGRGGTVVYIIDDFMGAAAANDVRDRALSECAFSWAQHAYPGFCCRNSISRGLAATYSHLSNQHIGQRQGNGSRLSFDGRDSFFGVVANRSRLNCATAPHIDFHGVTRYAAVHYLYNVENESSPSGGTAFFRDRSTGIERFHSSTQCESLIDEGVTGGICERAGDQAAAIPFMNRENPWYEVLAIVSPKFDRLVLYPANLIHGAWLDHAAVSRFLANMDGAGNLIERPSALAERAREGRLTFNLFGKLTVELRVPDSPHGNNGGEL